MYCWFCSIREAEADQALIFQMHSIVDAQKSESQTKIAYNVKQIEIPRCTDCHKRHIRVHFTSVLAIIMLLFLLISVVASLTGWSAEWLWGAGIALTAGLMAGLLAVRYYALKGIKSVRQAKSGFPDVKNLLDQGYKIGRQPKKLNASNFSS